MGLQDFKLFSDSNLVIKWTIIVFVIIAVIYLFIVSIMVKDLRYPKEHPHLFTLEILIFSVGCNLLVFLMAYGRNNLGLSTLYDFIIRLFGFGILYILLQFSGFFSYLFNY